MKRGISGAPIPKGLPFAAEISEACAKYDFPPCLAYAIRQNETDSGTDPAVMQIGSVGDFMPDGSNAGHGEFQLTSSWPSSSNPDQNWSDPLANAMYALEVFLVPAWEFWTSNTDLQGNDLVRAISSSFNAGLQQSWQWHLEGNVDAGTTNGYGARALANYITLTTAG